MQDDELANALGASYRLVAVRGRGATGEVWEALDRRTGETVAAKVLHAEHVTDRDLVARFLRERSILTGMRHPNLVAVRDLVVEGDRLAIVMDYVAGGSLRDVLHEEGTLAPAVAVGVVAEVLDALAYAHAGQVLHRDLKPDNVLLAPEWRDLSPGDVKLTDFGIARIVADRVRTTSGMLGTPEYMCPELLVTGTCDLPADVYGVGVLLYELLAGRTPFSGPGTDYTVAHRHVSSQPPPLPVPGPLWELLETLLDKAPDHRPSAAAAAAALHALLPALADVPALPVQKAPGEFDSARGPATVVRGLQPDPEDDAPTDPDAPAESLPDLGSSGQETMVRPMPRLPVTEPRVPRTTTAAQSTTRSWKDPRMVGMVLAGVALVVAGGFWMITSGSAGTKGGGGGGDPVRATGGSQATPTGLSINRLAVWDPETSAVELTLTYSAQRAPLRGPFLEVIPGVGEGDPCPQVTWQDDAASPNLSSVTGISTPCAWSVEPAPVEARGSTTVSARFALELPGESPTQELLTWLDQVDQATQAATSDDQVTTTAYPVQRLQGIKVQAPDRTTTGRRQGLPLTLFPIWPSGEDTLHPLYKSPSLGEPTTTLVAIAGGEEGIRFSDGCSGSLKVDARGLVVTPLSPAPECHVNASVGNLTDLTSNTFPIATSGS